MRPTEQITDATATDLIAAEKPLGERIIKMEMDPLGGRKGRICFEVHGHSLELMLLEKPHGSRQVILRVERASGNLARLCCCPAHGGQVHWHWKEDVAERTEELEVDAAVAQSVVTLFTQVAAPRLRITGVAVEEGGL